MEADHRGHSTTPQTIKVVSSKGRKFQNKKKKIKIPLNEEIAPTSELTVIDELFFAKSVCN